MASALTVWIVTAGLFRFHVRVFADIPVHCTQFQILGKWRFHVGTWRDGDPLCGGSHPDKADGHRSLTPPIRDFNQKEGGEGGYWLSTDFREVFTMEAIVKDWRVELTDVSENGRHFHPSAPKSYARGHWTMIYDEGWNINMEADEGDPNLHSMFAFSKYTLHPGDDAHSIDNNVNKQHSNCGMTLLGWYKIHDKGSLDIKKHMCYWGERIEHLYPVLLAQHEAKMPPQGLFVNRKAGLEHQRNLETQGTLLLGPDGSKLGGSANVGGRSRHFIGEHCPGGICDEKGQDLQGKGQKSIDPQAAKERLHDISIGNYAALTKQRLEDARANGTIVRYSTEPEKFRKFAQCAAFTEPYREPSTIHELINYWSPPPTLGLPALPGFSSEQILGPIRKRAISEQKQIAKDRGYSSTKQLTPEDMHEHWGAPAHNHHAIRTFYLNGRKLGPDEWRDRSSFDWRHTSLVMNNGAVNTTITGFVAPVPDQGNCGSCYAVAATSMLTARLMLRYPELYQRRFMDGDRISWHQQLDCNHYVQGCDGGYPMLVARWGFENDIVLNSCARAAGRGPECLYNNPECQEDRFRIRHYRYVGGSFGRCGSKRLCEAAIREELYKGGPMVVSVEPSDDFNAFTGGVLHRLESFPASNTEEPAPDDKNCTETECYTWRKIDHSMLLTGWGEDARYGRYCMPLPEEEREMDEECSLHKDSEEECKAAGCHYGGFPYWIIQNSWTESWGESGYLILGPRGQNPLMVEMMAVSADIVRKEDLGNYFSVRGHQRRLQEEAAPIRETQPFNDRSTVDRVWNFGASRGVLRVKDMDGFLARTSSSNATQATVLHHTLRHRGTA